MADKADLTPTPEAEEGDYHVVDIQGLRVGSRLRMPIQDHRSVLLLAEGQLITGRFLESLAARNVTQVKVHSSEMSRIYAGRPQGTSNTVPQAHPAMDCPERNDLTDELDDFLSRSNVIALPVQGEAFSETVERREATSYDHAALDEFVERRNQSIQQIGEVFDRLMVGGGLDVDALSTIADEAMADLQKDMDLFACLGVNPLGSDYPGRHSIHACMLSISIGTHLKLDRPTLKELAIGCLIHDAGMLMIDRSVFETERKLNSVEFLEITKHPVRIFDRMKEMRAIPTRSAFVAYQIHERPDGVGYPRRRQSNQIHFLSKVAAVADVYVALVSPRPHRTAILPHAAMQVILQAGKQGALDAAAANALLRTLSAYPLGSYVQLSDGRVGQVLRSNDTAFERPVVEAWSRDRLTKAPDVVDLLVDESLSILGPLPSLSAPFIPTKGAATAGEGGGARDGDGSLSAGHVDKRTRPRRPFRTNVTVYLPVAENRRTSRWQTMRAMCLDFSVGGLRLRTAREITDSLFLVELELTPGVRACIRARIAHHHALADGHWEYGIQFLDRLSGPPPAHEVTRM